MKYEVLLGKLDDTIEGYMKMEKLLRLTLINIVAQFLWKWASTEQQNCWLLQTETATTNM